MKEVKSEVDWKRVNQIIADFNLNIEKCNDGFFIVGGWDDVEILVKEYNRLDKRMGYGDLRVSSEGIKLGDNDVYEKGNWLSDKISPPYRKPEGLFDIDDILREHGFSDEYAKCDRCGDSVRTFADSYSWIPDFFIRHGLVICGNCIRNDKLLTEEYVKYLINKDDRANTILNGDELKKLRFKKCICDKDGNECAFETGLYEGDSPKEILKKAIEKNKGKQFIFDITENGQFDVKYTMWSRSL